MFRLSKETEHPLTAEAYEAFRSAAGGWADFDEERNLLTGDAVSEQLRNELQAKQKEMMLEPLHQLWQKAREERSTIKESIKHFEKRNSFSPAQLLFLFREMHERDISFTPKK